MFSFRKSLVHFESSISFCFRVVDRLDPCPPQPVSDIVPDRERKLSLDRCELIAKSIMETGWCNGQRFRCHWVHFLKVAFPGMSEELSAWLYSWLQEGNLDNFISCFYLLYPWIFFWKKVQTCLEPDWNLVLRWCDVRMNFLGGLACFCSSACKAMGMLAKKHIVYYIKLVILKKLKEISNLPIGIFVKNYNLMENETKKMDFIIMIKIYKIRLGIVF